MTTPTVPADSTPTSTSRFARNRAGWVLLGAVTVILPILWPVGAYILWKVYSERDSAWARRSTTATRDGWQ